MPFQCSDRSFAAHVLSVAAIILLAACLVGQAQGSGYGRNVVHNQVAVANAVVPYPVIGYQVGQHLQQAAIDEYGFRNSPSQQRLLYLEGAHAATLKFLESGFVPAPATGGVAIAEEVEATEADEAAEAETSPEPAVGPPLFSPQPPATDVDLSVLEGELAAILPGWATACAKCHSGEAPKGDSHIADELLQAIDDGDLETLEHFRDLVVTGKMPKGTALDDATQGALLLELQRAKQ